MPIREPTPGDDEFSSANRISDAAMSNAAISTAVYDYAPGLPDDAGSIRNV